jgi:type II secretory ATPase GspE/PulE/Tfp pilus assembly ATPase PilB-like protein
MQTTLPTITPMLTPVLAEAQILMSIAKPIMLVALFIPYMRFVAKFELDARRFTLPVLKLNALFLGVALVGLAVIVLIPIFWIGWFVAMLMFAGTMYGYWKYRDQKVPPGEKFKFATDTFSKAMDARRKAAAEKGAQVIFLTAKGERQPVPQKEDPALLVYLALEQALLGPLESRATRVDLASSQQGVTISMTVDGVRAKRDPLPPDTGNAAIDLLKKVSGLDPADRRRRQQGLCRMESPVGKTELTVTTSGSSSGQTIRIDFDRASRFGKSIDTLGLAPAQLEALRVFEKPERRKGVIIVTTPSGQGLTTLAYALIGRHDAYTSNVKTLEREVQHRVEGVDHKKFEPEPGVEDFGAMLTKIIRRDPDVVLCGDISEPGTAKAAALMGMESPLVYVLIPADSMATAIAMWMQAVGDPKMATRCLSAVVQQRVMRTLCPNCKSPFTPAPEQAKKLGIPSGKEVQLFRPSGKVQVKNRIEDCPVCQGSSYFGQAGVFEVMSLDDEARRLLSENDFRTAYARAVREQKMMQLQEAALVKVRDGDTSLEEVQRIFAPKQAAGAPKPAAAPKA